MHQQAIEATTKVSLGVTVGSSTATVALKAGESAGTLGFINEWAIAIGLAISLMGLMVHVASVYFGYRLKLRTVVVQESAKRPAPIKEQD